MGCKQTLLNSLSLNVKRLLRAFLFGFGVNGTVEPDGTLLLIVIAGIRLYAVSVSAGLVL